MTTRVRIVPSIQLNPVLIFTLIGLLFLLLLNHRPLNNPDESRYSEIAFEMLHSGDFITPRFNGILFLDKPPLYYWLQASAIKMFGPSNGSLRFFPALFALFGGICVYTTCKKLFSPQSALLSAIILLTSPLYFFIGLYANLDMEVAVLISNALLFFAVGEFSATSPKYKKRYYYAAYLSAGLAILTKGLIGIVLPALSVGLWLLLTGQLKRLKEFCIPSGLLLILLINAPWYYLAEQANPGFSHFFFYEQQFTRFVGHQFNAQNPFYFYPGLLLAGTFPWSVFSLQALYTQCKKARPAIKIKHKEKNNEQFKFQLKQASILLYFLCWLFSITFFFSLPASKLASYIIPAMPPLTILIAHYLYNEGRSNRLVPYAFYTMLAISFIILITLLAANHYLTLPAIGFYLILAAACTLFICACLTCIIKTRTTSYFLYVMTALTLCYLLTLSVPYWIEHLADKKPTISSTQQLAATIKKKSQQSLYAYKSFYYDLPILLGHPITIVETWDQPNLEQIDSWIGKFAWGQKKEGKKSPFLMLPSEFWSIWQNSSKKVLVITRKENLSDFKSYNLIDQHKRNVLISN